MVETQDLHLTSRDYRRSPVPYMLKTTAFVAMALTIAGGSWYVAVNMTTPSDLTAIYNCSAFFAYAFSVPLLNEKPRFDKIFSVVVAVVGVLVVAYGDSGAPDDTAGPGSEGKHEADNRLLGNIIIGIGSVLYGLYEVLYKKYACPPEGTSPGRSMIFANAVGSLLGCFTLFVLWVPLPILHVLGWETFQWPTGEAGWMMLISAAANASKQDGIRVIFTDTNLLPDSLFWSVPCPDLAHLTRPLVRRRSVDHLPRGYRGLDADGQATVCRRHHGRPSHHCGVLAAELEHVSRVRRRAATTAGGRGAGFGERRINSVFLV